MKKILLMIMMVALATSCRFSTTSGEKEGHSTQVGNVRDGMFIHVSSNDPHRVLMALRMAGLMSEDHDVIMYFDIKGIDAIVKNAPDFTMGEFPSSHAQIKSLIEKGIVIQACPGCLKVAGYTPDDLMEGIILADKEKFFNFTKGRILTLDY
jgi:predicted peroxiredoxin